MVGAVRRFLPNRAELPSMIMAALSIPLRARFDKNVDHVVVGVMPPPHVVDADSTGMSRGASPSSIELGEHRRGLPEIGVLAARGGSRLAQSRSAGPSQGIVI